MLKTLLLATVLAATPLVASAEDGTRLSDASFVGASRCLALAELPQLSEDGFDVSALRSAYDQNSRRRMPVILDQARNAERNARIMGRQNYSAPILRMHRDRACGPFLTTGLAHNGAEQPAG